MSIKKIRRQILLIINLIILILIFYGIKPCFALSQAEVGYAVVAAATQYMNSYGADTKYSTAKYNRGQTVFGQHKTSGNQGLAYYLDCSAFVQLAFIRGVGIEKAYSQYDDPSGEYTGFAPAASTPNGQIDIPPFEIVEGGVNDLKPGDVVMTRHAPDSNGKASGHVMIYTGSGKIIHCDGWGDSQGGKGAISWNSLSEYANKWGEDISNYSVYRISEEAASQLDASDITIPPGEMMNDVKDFLTRWTYVKVPFRKVTESSIDKNKTFSYQGIAKSSSQTSSSTPSNIQPGKYLGKYTITGYCPDYACTGKNPGDPGYGITKMGTVAKANHTIATDPSVIPLGTHVMINGKEYVAEDIGGAIEGNHIDMFYDDHDTAYTSTQYNVDVYVAGTSEGNSDGSSDGTASKGSTSNNSWRFSDLGKLLDWILGLMFTVVKSVFVGLATIIQIGTTYYIDAATGKAVESRLSNGMMAYLSQGMREDLKNSITLEKIVYNQVPILDVDVFNGNQAGGETIASGSFVMIIRNLVATLYMALRNVALIGMLIALIYLGIRLVTATIGEQKAEYRKKLTSWTVAFIIVFVMHYFLIGVMKINEITVNICSNLGKNLVSAVSGGEYFDLALAMRDLTYDMAFTKSALAMVLYFVMIFYMLKFLVIYFKRLFITSILIIIGPLLAIKNAIDKIRFNKSSSMSTWMKEYIFSVGTQTIHALMYTIFIGMTYKLMATSDSMRIAICILSCMFFRFMTTAEKLTRKMLKLVGNQSDSIMGDIDNTDIKDLFGFALIVRLNKLTSNMSVPKFAKRKYQAGKTFFKDHLSSEYIKIKRNEYMNKYLDAYMPDERGRRAGVTSDIDKKIDDLIVADLDYKMSSALGSISTAKNLGKSMYGFASGSVMMGIGPVVLGTTRVYTGTKTMSKILYSPIKGYKLSSKNMKIRGKEGTYKNIKQWTELNGTQGVADVIRKDYLNKRDDETAKNNLKVITLHQARKEEVALEQEIADKKETLLKGAEPGATKMEKELSKKYTKNIKKCVEDRMKTVDRKDIQKEVKTYMKQNGKFALTLNDFENIAEKFDVKVSGEVIDEKVQKEDFIENVKAETVARFIREVTEQDGISNEITIDEESMSIVENNLTEKLEKTQGKEKEGVQNALECLKDKKNELQGKEKLHIFSNLSEEQQKQVNQAIADATTDEVIEKEIPKLSRDQIVDTMKKAVNMQGSIKREEPIKEFKQVMNHVEKLRDIDEVSRELGNEPIYKDAGKLVETMINNTKITNREIPEEK